MNKILFSSQKDDWETPQDLFNKLNNKHKFTIDACANKNNTKCKKFYSIENSILKQKPINESIFMNPPYSRKVGQFIKWAYENRSNNKIVILIPARTDTKWFHDYIYGKAKIIFLKGRLKFEQNGKPKNTATFPSMIVIYEQNNRT